MPARTGQQYLESINRQEREVWIAGEKVTRNVADHPAFRGVARSLAALYDMQHQPDLAGEMTYASPTTGQPVGVSFLQPRTREDSARRRQMMMRWHTYTGGMMGRTADYLNAAIMAEAAAADFFAQADPRFAENIRRYYEYVRENDRILTHTLINPQVNRALGPSQLPDPYLAAGVVKETDGGILIRGARLLATLAPITDEIMVFPSTVIRNRPEDVPYAYAFAIPCDTPGLRFICRETFDYGKSHFDHPLGSRFEEMDAIVVFDDVLVPWERVFMVGRPDLCNGIYTETNAIVHMAHQVVVKNLAKAEFMLGLILKIVDAIGIGSFQHVHEKVREAVVAVETMRAFLLAAEEGARADRWGLMTPDFAPLNVARNWFPLCYPRLVEIVQQLGASGLMAIPTAADFQSPIRADLDRYVQGAGVDALERVKLFRLAWDVSMSAFGQRQVLYERFFFGDPVRMAGAMYNWLEKAPYLEKVQAHLDRMGWGG